MTEPIWNRPLHRRDLNADPLAQFRLWWQLMQAANLPEPAAMTLATLGSDGLPNARIVLLRGFDERGFMFFTNYEGGKGRELAAHAKAALVFFWPQLNRQVRIRGNVSRTSKEESEAYFQTRTRAKRLGAWASHQSQVLANREEFERRYKECEERFAGQEVPLPPFWGGFRLSPVEYDFWQGHPERLHDRFRYRPKPEGGWIIERLSP